MFRVAITAGLYLAFTFAVLGGTFAGYTATQMSPQGNILASAIAGAILYGAFGFANGATLAPLGLAAFKWLESNRPRYRLRTLLVVLALAPPLLAGAWLAEPTLLGFGELLGNLACFAIPIAIVVLFVVASARVGFRREP